MISELQKAGPNRVSSAAGFTVEVRIAGGVHYQDSLGPLEIDSEWLAEPHGIVVYAKQRKAELQARVDQVLPRVVEALEFLGHPVEIWR